MTDIHNPHDILARKVFGVPRRAADLFQSYGGDAVRINIDWSKLERVEKHQFGNFLDESITDGSFTAPLVDKVQDANALLLLEHKSYLDSSMMLQSEPICS
jgi:hypothetical protein